MACLEVITFEIPSPGTLKQLQLRPPKKGGLRVGQATTVEDWPSALSERLVVAVSQT